MNIIKSSFLFFLNVSDFILSQANIIMPSEEILDYASSKHRVEMSLDDTPNSVRLLKISGYYISSLLFSNLIFGNFGDFLKTILFFPLYL